MMRRALLVLWLALVACTSNAPQEKAGGFYVNSPSVTASLTGDAGGDLAGAFPSPTVAGLEGVPFSGSPDAGLVPTATDAGTIVWLAPAAVSSVTMGGDVTGASSASTVAKVNGTTYPAGGSLTTGAVPRVTAASTVAYGAVDIGNANAVTLASSAQGDVLYFNGTTFARLGQSTTGLALLTQGVSANPVWGTNFGANNIVTTGTLSVGTTPSTTGNLALPSAGTIKFRNAANSADLTLVSSDSSNNAVLGNTTGNTIINAATLQAVVGSGLVTWQNGNYTLSATTPAPTFQQTTTATNSATGVTMSIKAQSASGTTSTGGDLTLASGTGTSANGSVNLQNVATTASAPSAGGAGALPATPLGYVTLKINGTAHQIPYY